MAAAGADHRFGRRAKQLPEDLRLRLVGRGPEFAQQPQPLRGFTSRASLGGAASGARRFVGFAHFFRRQQFLRLLRSPGAFRQSARRGQAAAQRNDFPYRASPVNSGPWRARRIAKSISSVIPAYVGIQGIETDHAFPIPAFAGTSFSGMTLGGSTPVAIDFAIGLPPRVTPCAGPELLPPGKPSPDDDLYFLERPKSRSLGLIG